MISCDLCGSSADYVALDKFGQEQNIHFCEGCYYHAPECKDKKNIRRLA